MYIDTRICMCVYIYIYMFTFICICVRVPRARFEMQLPELKVCDPYHIATSTTATTFKHPRLRCKLSPFTPTRFLQACATTNVVIKRGTLPLLFLWDCEKGFSMAMKALCGVSYLLFRKPSLGFPTHRAVDAEALHPEPSEPTFQQSLRLVS